MPLRLLPPSWFGSPRRDSLPARAPAGPVALSKVTVWLAEPSATVVPPFGDVGSLHLKAQHQGPRSSKSTETDEKQRQRKSGRIILVHLDARKNKPACAGDT